MHFLLTKKLLLWRKVRILENVYTRISNEFDYFLPTKCFENDWNRRYVCRRNYSTPQWFSSEAFNQYFPYEQQVKYQNYFWIKNFFIVNIRLLTMLSKEYEILIEIISNLLLQDKF